VDRFIAYLFAFGIQHDCGRGFTPHYRIPASLLRDIEDALRKADDLRNPGSADPKEKNVLLVGSESGRPGKGLHQASSRPAGSKELNPCYWRSLPGFTDGDGATCVDDRSARFTRATHHPPPDYHGGLLRHPFHRELF